MARPTKRLATNRKIAEALSKMDDAILDKIRTAFSIDCNIREACIYAEITETTYYNWKKKNPELFEKIEKLREEPVLKAKTTIYNNLGDVNTAKWLLERKRKADYGNQLDVTTGGDKIQIIAYVPDNGRSNNND